MKKHKQPHLTPLLCATLLLVWANLLAITNAAEKDKSDLDQLMGTWVVETSEKGPAPVSPVGSTPSFRPGDKMVVFKKDGELVSEIIRKEHPDRPMHRRAIAVDAEKKPRQINFAINKENIARGIYKLGKDRLTVCAGDMIKHDESERPTEFKAERKNELTVYRRERE